MTRIRLVLSLLLVMLFLQSCGFKLRGSLDISPELSPLYLQRNSSFKLAREVKLLLSNNKIEVTKDADRARSQLILLGEKQDSRVMSVDSDGRAKEYLLSYTVEFKIKFYRSGQWDAVDVAEAITVSRTLLFDQSAVLAVSNESEILYDDMRRNVARLILLRMQARSVDAAAAVPGKQPRKAVISDKQP